jgi:hypothetical protein
MGGNIHNHRDTDRDHAIDRDSASESKVTGIVTGIVTVTNAETGRDRDTEQSSYLESSRVGALLQLVTQTADDTLPETALRESLPQR